MKKDIQQKLVELFNTLDKPTKKVVNDYIIREKKVANCAIFIGDTKTSDEDGKEVCVMLKKAIDAGDFSAFKGTAPKPEPEKKDKPAPKTEPNAEPKAKPDPTPAPSKAPERPSSSALEGDLTNALIEFVKRHAPKAGGTVEKPAAEGAPSVSEDRIREIATEAADKVFDERINGAIADYFKRITG